MEDVWSTSNERILGPMTNSDRSPARFGPGLTAGIGLVLAIAGALSSPEGTPPAGFATRIWVPLPDWLGYGTAAAVSLASLTLIAMTLGRRQRRNEVDDYEPREPERVPSLFKVLLIVLALTPGTMIAAVTYWFGQSSHLLLSHQGSDWAHLVRWRRRRPYLHHRSRHG
jgi:hypothetical protein